jgi:hypothetical protein
VNHRELVLSARKKARFAFLSLPEELQDEVVEGLDSQAMGLVEASALVKSRGYSLSHEAIAGYYRAVRTERRLLEINQELSRVIKEFAKKPQKEALESLVNLVIATAATGLADGSVGIKDVDLAKLVLVSSSYAGSDAAAPGGKDRQPGAGGAHEIPTAEKIKQFREMLL